MSHAPQHATLQYVVARSRDGWEITEETMPESVLHDEAVELLKALLAAWAARVGNAKVVRNLAVRWDETRPRVGVDPDVCVLRPPPADAQSLKSVRTWLPDHRAPVLAVEVVSETNLGLRPNHPDRYAIAPEKYAASGTTELWIFDPLLCGPTSHGGPFRLQVWRRGESDEFSRIYAGDGPAFSPEIGAWLVVADEGHKLRIATDETAADFWFTAEEAERAAKDRALARVAELEAELARRGK